LKGKTECYFHHLERMRNCMVLGSCLFLHFHEIIVELSWISCFFYCGYFDYVKSDENMLLLHENLCLVVISWWLWVFSLIQWKSWSCWWMVLNLCSISLLWHWVCVCGGIMLLLWLLCLGMSCYVKNEFWKR